MGTRADFYIGVGPDAEWLGSVAWDGYVWEENPQCNLMIATTEEQFRIAVRNDPEQREDWTSPDDGWPWPWENSKTTDYAYAFHDGKVHIYNFSSPPEGWPDMSKKRNISKPGDKRSGVMMFME